MKTGFSVFTSSLLKKYHHLWWQLYWLIYLPWFAYLEKTVTKQFHVIHMSIDDYIPFCEYFVIPYFLWFAYVAIGIIYFAIKNKEEYYNLCKILFWGSKHPIVPAVMDYRMLTKLKSTYADGLMKVIGEDGRVHTTFQNLVTATGRLSSTDPNIQNIPVRTDLGAQIRKMFVPREGCVLVDADYSQIELRVLAHIAQDQHMQEAFCSGVDIHTATAAQVFGVPRDQVTAIQRRHAKAVNFGIVYGISEYSLAEDIGVSFYEAKEYIENYLNNYSGVRRYMKDVVETARKTGFTTTIYGRKRYIPELTSSNFNIRSGAERIALNTPIQGTAADLIKLAMLRVEKALSEHYPQAQLLLQVHDELIVECPEDIASEVAQLVSREMEGIAFLNVPLTAEAKYGKSWYDAK